MKPINHKNALACAVEAARAAGRMMRDNLRSTKKVNEATPHDIKLELDVRCQKRIERTLRRGFPGIPILGEEGVLGDPQAPWRWVVDPIDGTVNFFYGIPHACVSIALQASTSALQSILLVPPPASVYSMATTRRPSASMTIRVIVDSVNSVKLPVRMANGIGVFADVYFASTSQPFMQCPQ